MAEAAEQFPVGLRVLVVDDDLTCLAILRQMLLKCRYDVTTCSQATKALSLLRESRGGFHVVISDVHMPDMDGFRLLELVGLEMDLPVIMMSADARTNVVMQGIKHGACDYLIKPVRIEELKNIWQHVVRKKWRDNDLEPSGSLDDTDHSKQFAEDVDYASSVNDGADATWKSQKKKRNGKDKDDSELESDPSSKKPRVVWSVELHQQFVNAVNQLGIDQAVPKRILELMNVPGLTRENVASHLQKFRLYLKRLSGVPQQHGGLPSSYCAPASSVKASNPPGGLDFRALAASGQIPPQTLAALQDELLDQPSGSLSRPLLNQPSLPASTHGTKRSPMQREIAFGQPLFKCRTNFSWQFRQSSMAVPDIPFAFSSWTSNDLAVTRSAVKFGGLDKSQNSNMLGQMLQQQQELNPPVTESLCSLNVQPSCVVIPSKPLNNVQGRENRMLIPSSPQLSSSLQADNPLRSKNQDATVVPSQSSTSLNMLTNSHPIVENSIIFPSQSLAKLQRDVDGNHISNPDASQSLINIKTENYPLHASQNSMLVSPEPSSSLQADNGPILRNDNLSCNSSSTTLDYTLLSSQSKNVQFGVGQIVDDRLRNSPVSTCYSLPGLISSPASTSTDGSTTWQGHSTSGNNNTSSASPSFSRNFSKIQNSTSLLGNLPNHRQGGNLGFVGKGTSIPSRFAVDDVELPNNKLDQSNIFINDGGGIVNPETFEFDELL